MVKPEIASTVRGNDALLRAKADLTVDPRKFFAELQRRNVYRAAVVYTMTSWLVIQVATQVFPIFSIPSWIVRLIIILLIAGLWLARARFTRRGKR